jgi:hypothetical protein
LPELVVGIVRVVQLGYNYFKERDLRDEASLCQAEGGGGMKPLGKVGEVR